MDQNFLHDPRLESQIRECFGKVAYTHKAHEKCADWLINKRTSIKTIEIILSAVTTGGFLYSIFGDNKFVTILGVVASSIMLILTLYFKEFKLEELAEKHRVTALKLWDIRESYVSLLVDLKRMTTEDIVMKRDTLQNQLLKIYEQAPRTTLKGYTRAQKSLKQGEELTFSDEEIDVMLPQELRKK